jgi:hypothetical protein
VTSAALCAELADEFAAAGVVSAIAGIIGPPATRTTLKTRLIMFWVQ